VDRVDIVISPEFRELMQKLWLCHDPKTMEQVFIGAIKVTVEGPTVILQVEEKTWETPGGAIINTDYIRGVL
jgi:hypothetical protein